VCGVSKRRAKRAASSTKRRRRKDEESRTRLCEDSKERKLRAERTSDPTLRAALSSTLETRLLSRPPSPSNAFVRSVSFGVKSGFVCHVLAHRSGRAGWEVRLAFVAACSPSREKGENRRSFRQNSFARFSSFSFSPPHHTLLSHPSTIKTIPLNYSRLSIFVRSRRKRRHLATTLDLASLPLPVLSLHSNSC
jgi:hypothetical protein